MLFWGGIPRLVAQEEELHLSVADAQKYAIEHNRSMQNASIDVKKSEQSKWQALATMLPQVNASFDYTNYCGFQMNFGGMGIAMNPVGNLSLTASIALSGVQVVSVQLADMAKQMALINYLKSDQDIRNQVKNVYCSILAMEETMDLLNKSLENLRTLKTFAENSVNVGISEQTDADQISVQVLAMENSIHSNKRAIELLYNSMRLHLGATANTEIKLTENLNKVLKTDQILALASENFDLNNNYNYQLLQKNVELQKKQVALTWWNYAPTLSAYYQYSEKTYFGKAEGLNMTPPNLIGASLNIPLFSSFSRYSKVKEAKLAKEAAENNLATTADQLLIQEKQLRYNLTSAYETFQMQQENIEVSQRVFDNITKKYAVGMASSLDVTNSSNTLIAAQNNYVQAMLGLLNAQIELEKLLNK